jgi:hypothetical protein
VCGGEYIKLNTSRPIRFSVIGTFLSSAGIEHVRLKKLDLFGSEIMVLAKSTLLDKRIFKLVEIDNI